jgi:aspartate dehydrogenase
MRVGIVGCGTIGRAVVEGLAAVPEVTAVALFDRRAEAAAALVGRHRAARALGSLEELVDASDLVVEAASQEAARSVVRAALGAGRSVLVMSVGAFADDAFLGEALAAAARGPGRLLIPSGAVGALDALASAAEAGLDEVTLTTRKPPAGLRGAPYLVERGLTLERLAGATVVFEGTAREAVSAFPANVNVAAAVAIAGVGFDRTRVRVVADPAATTNRHEVHARGAFGELAVTVDNRPFPSNPKTSHLAALSAIASVKRFARGTHLGP